MKPWHAAAIGWGHGMAAYVGSHIFGRDFFIAMVLSGAAALVGAVIIWLRGGMDL